jgi:hypothetical protein
LGRLPTFEPATHLAAAENGLLDAARDGLAGAPAGGPII